MFGGLIPLPSFPCFSFVERVPEPNSDLGPDPVLCPVPVQAVLVGALERAEELGSVQTVPYPAPALLRAPGPWEANSSRAESRMAEADLAPPVEARCAAPTVAEAQHAERHDKFSAPLAQRAEAVEVVDKSAAARAP